MLADFASPNAVLIHYRGGAYGNFIFHVLSTHIDHTVKVNNSDFKFSDNGNSHFTAKYVNNYYLAGQLDKKLKSYSDYQYQPTVTNDAAWQQIQAGKKFLVLCDTSVVDNHQYLLNMWPQAMMIRSYMPNFIDRLVGYANLIQKALRPTHSFKNSLFDDATMQQFKEQGGDLDTVVEDATLRLLQQNFNLYGKTFVKAVDHARVYNFGIGCLSTWSSFVQTVHDCAGFLHSSVINIDALNQLYNEFVLTQSNLRYYQFTKHTVPESDDLIGRALVRFLQQ